MVSEHFQEWLLMVWDFFSLPELWKWQVGWQTQTGTISDNSWPAEDQREIPAGLPLWSTCFLFHFTVCFSLANIHSITMVTLGQIHAQGMALLWCFVSRAENLKAFRVTGFHPWHYRSSCLTCQHDVISFWVLLCRQEVTSSLRKYHSGMNRASNPKTHLTWLASC